MRQDATTGQDRNFTSHIMVSSSTLLPDNTVKSLWGTDLGRVEELVIEVSTGHIRYALLSFGGFLGATDRWFAVPWSLLTVNRATRTIYLHADRPALRFAPKFNRRDRRKRYNLEYLRQVDAHFQTADTADDVLFSSAAV